MGGDWQMFHWIFFDERSISPDSMNRLSVLSEATPETSRSRNRGVHQPSLNCYLPRLRGEMAVGHHLTV